MHISLNDSILANYINIVFSTFSYSEYTKVKTIFFTFVNFHLIRICFERFSTTDWKKCAFITEPSEGKLQAAAVGKSFATSDIPFKVLHGLYIYTYIHTNTWLTVVHIGQGRYGE